MTRPYQKIAQQLAVEKTRNGKGLSLLVSGRSMHPLLIEGDRVCVESISLSQIRRGDLMTVRRGEGFVTHRVVGFKNRMPVLKGDNAGRFDPQAEVEDFIGRVETVTRSGCEIPIGAGFWRMTGLLMSKIGWYEGRSWEKETSFWKWIAFTLRLAAAPIRGTHLLLFKLSPCIKI